MKVWRGRKPTYSHEKADPLDCGSASIAAIWRFVATEAVSLLVQKLRCNAESALHLALDTQDGVNCW